MDTFFNGQGIPASGSFIRDMDARVKLLFGGACVAMSAASSSIYPPLFVGALCAVMLAASGESMRRVAIRAAEPVFLGFALALFQAFLVPGEKLFGLDVFGFGLEASREGVMRGAYIIARVSGGVLVVLFVSMTTPFERLLSAAAWLRAPRGLVEITMFAYRYVFALLDDALTVYWAQKGRLGYSSAAQAARSLGTLTGSVFLRAYGQAEATGEAMSLRGYSGSYVPVCGEKGRTLDFAVMGGLALVALTLFIWT